MTCILGVAQTSYCYWLASFDINNGIWCIETDKLLLADTMDVEALIASIRPVVSIPLNTPCSNVNGVLTVEQ